MGSTILPSYDCRDYVKRHSPCSVYQPTIGDETAKVDYQLRRSY
ncbi:MAG: hypothetical protein ACI4UA_03080 [Bacteroidaceae bacterium]